MNYRWPWMILLILLSSSEQEIMLPWTYLTLKKWTECIYHDRKQDKIMITVRVMVIIMRIVIEVMIIVMMVVMMMVIMMMIDSFRFKRECSFAHVLIHSTILLWLSLNSLLKEEGKSQRGYFSKTSHMQMWI